MTVTLAVALLALLVASFGLVALVAVHARVRALEASAGVGTTGYPALVGRPAPASVRPRPHERCALVAVVDGECVLCRAVLAELAAVSPESGVRVVALTDRADDLAMPAGSVRVDPAARADLFEGYAPTVLAVDGAGTVVARRFVYPDTDVRALLAELTAAAAPSAQIDEPARAEESRA
jgi:hypothetical protein